MKIVCDVAEQSVPLARLRQAGHEIICISPPEERARELPSEFIHDAEGLFCALPPTNFEEMKKLRWIQITSTGYSQLFPLRLTDRGIRATNSRGCFDVPIAEWNVAMMVALARDLRQMIRNQEAGIWDRSAIFQREIRGLTVGIWGYGGIGRETARLCRHLGLRVHVFTRGPIGSRGDVYCVPGTGDPDGRLPDRVFHPGEEATFLADLDFLILALPLTKATEGLIGERELKALPTRAFLLNPARGPIVNQAALLRALREQWIAGAALDTHYLYPTPPDHPLWKFPNVIFTPHIAGSGLSPHFGTRLWEIFSSNVERFVHGQPLLNELTAAQLDGA